jgi:hypothetical protein
MWSDEGDWNRDGNRSRFLLNSFDRLEVSKRRHSFVRGPVEKSYAANF